MSGASTPGSYLDGTLTGTRVCLVTSGHPSTNPRLVKEADALVEEGCDVRVVVCQFITWAERFDRTFSDRPWIVNRLTFGDSAGLLRDLWYRLRRRLCREAVEVFRPWLGLIERAYHYVIPELKKKAGQRPADLFIAHNLAALPAAAHAANVHASKLGFDAEDFHRGELPAEPEFETVRWMAATLEERYIPECDYVTAASDGIAEAYAEALGITRPTTVLNVFPRSERETTLAKEKLRDEKPAATTSLYWFSQTIGPNRGLEDALYSLQELPESVCLTLRGRWAKGYRDAYMQKAEAMGVASRVHHRELVPPHELVPRTRQHDIGLALERPSASRNKQLCVSNKLFTYLLAGIPVVATETKGQRRVCRPIGSAVRLYSPGDSEAFAQAARDLVDNESARTAAVRAGERRYNWDREKHRFLKTVNQALRSV